MVTKNGDEYVAGGENTNIEITQNKIVSGLEINNLDEYLAE